MTLYTYEYDKKYEGLGLHVKSIVAVKETNFSAIIEKLAYIAEWFSVGFLFYQQN